MSEDRCPVCARPAHASTMIDATCLTASQLSALRRAHPEAAPIKEACRSCAVESRGAALADLAAAAGWYSPNAAAAADVAEALRDGFVSGGTHRNLDWVRPHLTAGPGIDEDALLLLADAQTSGGLLVVGEVPGYPIIGRTVPVGAGGPGIRIG